MLLSHQKISTMVDNSWTTERTIMLKEMLCRNSVLIYAICSFLALMSVKEMAKGIIYDDPIKTR